MRPTLLFTNDTLSEKKQGQLFGPGDFWNIEVKFGNVGKFSVVVFDTLLVTFWCLENKRQIEATVR